MILAGFTPFFYKISVESEVLQPNFVAFEVKKLKSIVSINFCVETSFQKIEYLGEAYLKLGLWRSR